MIGHFLVFLKTFFFKGGKLKYNIEGMNG